MKTFDEMRERGMPALGHEPYGSAVASLPDGILSNITHLLVSEGSPARVLEAVADALHELVPHDTLTLYIADEPLRVLRPVLSRDRYSAEILGMGTLPYGHGITGMAADTREPQLVNDAHLDPRAGHVPGTPVEPESLLAVPLLAHGELKGVLALYRSGVSKHFAAADLRLLTRFAELAALAIDNAQTRAKLETEVVTDHLTALYNHRYFHERLGEELRRANRKRSSVGLLIYDIDDFKRVNDTHGHLVGDQVLQAVAAASREVCRGEDLICRIGGEEFAVILPACGLAEAVAVGERLRGAIAGLSFPFMDGITVSVGVSEGPLHASSPRELMAAADLALSEAKLHGKDQVRVYVDEAAHEAGPVATSERAGAAEPVAAGTEQPRASARNGEHRTGYRAHARLAAIAAAGEGRLAAHLRVVERLSAKLNRLIDPRHIGEAITAELRSLIDYHNCRVHLLEADERTLTPVAFRGELSEYQGETFDALVLQLGEGITGRAAETGETYYAPDASQDATGKHIPGTPDLVESILAVPMRYGDRVSGTIVLSKLGVDQFDEPDRRLLEVVASTAAVAFENARLLQVEREAAEASAALLELSQALTRASASDDVLHEALATIPAMVRCSVVQAWIRDHDTRAFRLVRQRGREAQTNVRTGGVTVPADVAEPLLLSVERPFVLSRELVESVPPEYRLHADNREVLVAPMRWEPEGLGALCIIAAEDAAAFSDRDVRLARGIADITSLALGNVRRFVELERAYVSTIEALANALEAKDEYTSDHARALAEMTLAVGAELGMPHEELKRLELAALFHDIGKIGVPSEIIRKPGPLTAAERRIMAKHPEIGEQILAPVPFLQSIRPIVRACHERWDGRGYPDGLAGERIPLEARIVFVCDAFHAMTSDRPYRKALSEETAVRRLRRSAGRQFDPRVVDAFVRVHASGAIHSH